ncbi:MAG: sugar ABC transporter permease [Candidatus Omnitrophica bacterium]|nr:sugar ABC transporter permease [Candidatus Omnitrophota bacterium]
MTDSFPKKLVFKDSLKNFLFAFPAIAIFCIFYIVPFIEVFRLSLMEWNGTFPPPEFIGADNFIEQAQDKLWWGSMVNAGFITIIALTFQNILAFALALACDREIKARRFYRVVFFIPPVLSEIVVGIIWQWILYSGMQGGEHIGLLNYLLAKTGLPHLVHNWLSDPKTALACISIVHCWKGFGWGFVLFLAGLQTIDKQLYEAAKVDGAGGWNVFRHITVPMMAPIIVVVMILTVLGSMQIFIVMIAMVGQGGLADYTSVPVLQILFSMNGAKRFGYACSQSIIFGLILICVSAFFKIISNRVKQA